MKFLSYIFIALLFVSESTAVVRFRRKHIKILVAGDVMFDWGFRNSYKKLQGNIIGTSLKKVFRQTNYRMINLETPVTYSNIDRLSHKSYVFRAYPTDLAILQKLHINLAFLGNNHSMDYGKTGLLDTFSYLRQRKIRYAGAGLNSQDAYRPVRLSRTLHDYFLVSASQIGPNSIFAGYKQAGSARYSLNQLAKIPGKKGNYLLALHWGIEYNPEPYGWQISAAHKLIRSGYKVIIGHHPHIPQGVEKYRDGIILYSLGNFIFGSRNQYLNHNLMAILHFEAGQLLQCELVPVFGKFQFRKQHRLQLLPKKQAEEFLFEIAVLSEKLNTKIAIKNGRGYINFR